METKLPNPNAGFNPESGSGMLADKTTVRWETRGRSGSTPKYGGYPIDCRVASTEGVTLFEGTALDAREWLKKAGYQNDVARCCVCLKPLAPGEGQMLGSQFIAPEYRGRTWRGDYYCCNDHRRLALDFGDTVPKMDRLYPAGA